MFRWRHEPLGTQVPVDPIGWLDAPPDAWPSRILAGVVLPLVLLLAGIVCMVTRSGVFIAKGWHALRGGPALALGVAAIGAAIFFHAHAYWGSVRRLQIIHQVGRAIGAILFIAGFGYVLWSILWMG